VSERVKKGYRTRVIMAGDHRRGVMRAFKHAVRAVLPEPAAAVLAAMQRHKWRIGRYPNLLRPITFNEKLLYRSLFDRRPIWTQLQDKYAARKYVSARIGEQALPRLYWVTRDPADIPFDELPEKFVVKPNHGSGWIALVPDKAQLNRQELVETCRGWLRQNYYDHFRERHYKPIVPRIMVEEYIDDGTGPAPTDYKLHVFGGRVELISVMRERFQDVQYNLYRRPADVTCRMENIRGSNNSAQDLEPPPHLATMIAYAEALGKGLDYIRVDLYDTPDKVYFGELTPTPAAGTEPFEPRELDRYLGKLWPHP
jgi:TupA-like ATPgrasp